MMSPSGNAQNKHSMQIPKDTFTAVMVNATRAYIREDWLSRAQADVDQGAAVSASEQIRARFAPYADRLIGAATGIPQGREDDARELLFQRFIERI